MLRNINWSYALGEILIVIIGISIAFGLNRFTEQQKETAQRTQYRNSLVVDLDREMEQLQANVDSFQQRQRLIQELFPYLYGKQEGRAAVGRNIFKLGESIAFYPTDITYRTLISSGDLDLFTDFELRMALEDHYARHQRLEKDYLRQERINERYFADFMIYEMDYRKVGKGDFSFMDSPLLRNTIQSLYGTYGIAIATSKAGMERCRALKALLVASN